MDPNSFLFNRSYPNISAFFFVQGPVERHKVVDALDDGDNFLVIAVQEFSLLPSSCLLQVSSGFLDPNPDPEV